MSGEYCLYLAAKLRLVVPNLNCDNVPNGNLSVQERFSNVAYYTKTLEYK